MDAKELLETLSRCDQLPLEEVAWAEAHREQPDPVFQAYLRRYLDEPAKNETPTPLLLVMSFLGVRPVVMACTMPFVVGGCWVLL